MSGNRSSLKIDLITEDPKIRKLYCIQKSITNNRNTGNKSLYNCTKKYRFYLTLLSSSSRSALALVLLALQHSHIAPEVTYIHISNIFIFAFWHHRLVSYSRKTYLLVRQYYYFCTEYSYMHV